MIENTRNILKNKIYVVIGITKRHKIKICKEYVELCGKTINV